MSSLPILPPKKIIKALQKAGFYIHHISGSHCSLRHPQKPDLRITVAYHNKDLAKKTIGSIIKQAGLTVEEFIDLL